MVRMSALGQQYMYFRGFVKKFVFWYYKQMEKDPTKGWYRSPSGKIEYISHMQAIWKEMAVGATWQYLPYYEPPPTSYLTNKADQL